MAFRFALAALVSLFFSDAKASTKIQYGTASYYGSKHHGKKTASGRVFNKHEMTTAHRSIPFGKKVKITNTSNGKSAIFTVTDRGPFVKGRIADVSQAGALALGFFSKGVTQIKLEILD